MKADSVTAIDARFDRENAHEPFLLTDLQQSYLLGHDQVAGPGGVSPSLTLEFATPGLDVPRLEGALRRVVERHDMLRAVLGADGCQVVLREVPPYRIETTDLRGASPQERAAHLEALRGPGDRRVRVGEWAPFDVRVTLLADGDTRLHLDIGLFFLDVRSVLRLLSEWRRHYTDPRWSPAPTGLTFRDVVLGAAEDTDTDAEARAERYWLDRVPALPAAPELPLATPPEQIERPVFVAQHAVVDARRTAALAAAAAQRGVTTSAVLLAAYCEVLRTWAQRSAFVVTRTLSGRRPVHPDVDRVLGDFIAPGLFEYSARKEQTFAERVEAVHRRMTVDDDHATFSGLRVLREITRARRDGRVAAMPVVFSSLVDHDPGRASDLVSGFGAPVHIGGRAPQVWLENQVLPVGDEIAVTWNRMEGLFPEGMAEAMFAAYRTLLDRLADDERTWWLDGGVVPLPADQADERARVNATSTSTPAATLHGLVGRAARSAPDAVAVVEDGAECTFGVLVADAHRLAHRLRDRGDVTPDRLVAVSMPPGAAQISALLGVLHAGAAYVAIDPELPEARRHALLSRCHVDVVVTEPGLREALRWPDAVDVLTLSDPGADAYPSTEPDAGQTVDDLAYVIFTSGSTGEPKGVMITHRSACNTVLEINRRFGVGPQDRVLALAPTGFDLSVYDVFGVLGAGGAIVIPPPDRAHDVAVWSESIARHGVSIWNSVPAPMRLWVDSLTGSERSRYERLRLVLMSGDWIPTDLPDRIRAHVPGAEVISLGGATEGSIWSICRPVGEVAPHWTSIPYGKPLANQTTNVYDDWGEPCPVWATGEIHIGGVGVAQGYWEDPVRTAERFVWHPHTGERLYRTGDLGRYLPGGDIEILGREDQQVKINGYRVELGEVEACLTRQPGVRECLVTAPVHPRTGQRQLVAHLVPAAGESLTTDRVVALREAVAATLPSFMVPAHYLPLDRLPLTPNGKIDHAAVPVPWREGAPDVGSTPATTGTEKTLVAVWAEQLGHDEFSTDDGFFDVGGDSLHAVGILRLLRERFGVDPAREQDLLEGLFMNASISDFAVKLESLGITA